MPDINTKYTNAPAVIFKNMKSQLRNTPVSFCIMLIV